MKSVIFANAKWNLEPCWTMPAVNPELQRAALSIYGEEEQDGGILTGLTVGDEGKLLHNHVVVD